MYVTRVRIEDIKGFAGERVVDLELPVGGSWTVLAGRNGSGKSTLLRALGLVLAGPSVSRSLMADFSDWISLKRPSGRVHAHIARDEAADLFSERGRTPKGELVLGQEWVREEAPDKEALEALQPHLFARGTLKDERNWRGPWAENPRGWFCAGYGPFRRLLGDSGEAQRLMLTPGPAGRMATLFHEDASLSEGVSWLIALHLRRLERRKGAGTLLKTVVDLLAHGLLPDGYRVSKVDSQGLWVARKGSGETFPLREMSDGYRAVAGLVLDIVRQIHAVYGALDATRAKDGGVTILTPGVVLIDEVDAHLHVTWQRIIGGWLRSHFPNIQFIVSTHSPYVCQAADPGGLIRLPGPDEQLSPRVVDEQLYQRIVYGSGDDAALSELFGLETGVCMKRPSCG